MENIVTSLIGCVGSLAGSLCGILVSSKLTNYRIEQLEKKVDKHNHFAERLPLLENAIKELSEEHKSLKDTVKELHNDRTVL